MIEHLYKLRSDDASKSVVLYTYCDYRDRELQTPRNLIGAMLAQIVGCLNSDNLLVAELQRLHKEHRPLGSTDTIEFLRKAIQQFDSIFLCADALDEVSEDTRRDLLKCFYILCCSSSARVFLTGRDNAGVLPKVSTIFTPETRIQQIPVTYVPITTNSNSIDLRKFLTEQINNAKSTDGDEQHLMNNAFESEIIDTLSSAT